jgi:3',5'-cyclic AMP phosphodiesterase CpdA
VTPHVVAVSGDLTQRARGWQFRQARAFLDRLPGRHVVVPGNHDIPLYNVLARFGVPRRRFRRHITADRWPAVLDDEVAVFGADTTRSFTIKDGRLRAGDLRRLGEVLEAAGDVVKIVVCHHPFDDRDAVNALVAGGADVLLTGHLHLSYVGHTATRYQAAGRSAIVVEAGTATSVRARGEANSFNLLHVERGGVRVERLAWDEERRAFVLAQVDEFARDQRTTGWK